MEEDNKMPVKQKIPENMTVYDPDKPLYERRHLCIYLRELLDEAEKELEKTNPEK
jgi:hypothetical protein